MEKGHSKKTKLELYNSIKHELGVEKYLLLRGSDSSDFTSLGTLKFKNHPFQHISMYCSYLALHGTFHIWILDFSIFSDFPVYMYIA